MNERNDPGYDESSEEIADETESNDAKPHFAESPEEYVERYSHCRLCGSNLHFSHVTDFARNITQELARCPECGVRARKATHSLQ